MTPPVVVRRYDPEYSEEARRKKFAGDALVSAVVDSEGNVRDVQVVKGLGMGLDEKAIEAVQKWKFKPGTKDGKPVNVRIQVQLAFRLL